MFGDSILELITQGGFTIYILILCSILALKIIIEKYAQFSALNRKSIDAYVSETGAMMKDNRFAELFERLKRSEKKYLFFSILNPLANVFLFIAKNEDMNKDDLEKAATNKLDVEISEMEKGLNILATLGSISPFIGLLGTVIGIIKSFSALSVQDASNYANVISGIAEALIATAAGLFVAIPSVMFYNYFNKRVKLSIPLYDGAIHEFIRTIKIKQSAGVKK